jgi:hypothetical protein
MRARIFQVNLQVGFILAEKSDNIIGAYSHHNRIVCFSESANNIQAMRVELPDAIYDYEQTFNQVSGFSIVGWTNDGYKQFSDLKKGAKKYWATPTKPMKNF